MCGLDPGLKVIYLCGPSDEDLCQAVTRSESAISDLISLWMLQMEDFSLHCHMLLQFL